MPASVASGTGHNGYTLTIARPSGVAAGDLLVAHITSDGDNITLGAPGGWVDLGGATGVDRTSRAFYKIATNGEPASYTFTSSSGNAYRVCMVRVTGAPTSNPIAVNPAWNGNNGSSTTFTTPAQTAPSGGALQLVLLAVNGTGAGTISMPSGFSSTHALNTDTPNAIIASRSVSAGSTGNPTFGWSGSTVYNHMIGSLLISSGQVVSISRSVTPAHTNVRSVIKSLSASVTPAGVTNLTRVVVKVIARTFGAATTTDAITDPFSDSFSVAAGQPGPTLTRTFLKTPVKTFDRSILTYGGYAKVTQKLVTAAISIVGYSRRTAVRRFTASIAPSANLTVFNIGRLFGTPGVIDITVRLAGEVRARVRRR